MSETTCPHCDVEMTMHGVACLGNPSTNEILYCCPVCRYKTFIPRPPVIACTNKGKSAGQLRGSTKLIYCKDCAHLCYEDLGIYYCGLHRIAGQLSPEDYCSRGERKEKRHENH